MKTLPPLNSRRLSRKVLTSKEAERKMANLWQLVTAHEDCINYWRAKIGKPLEWIDIFILGTDKLKSAEEFIEMSFKELDIIYFKIYEDYGRYGDPHEARKLVK